MNVKTRLQELVYWRISRPAHNLFRNFIWMLPRAVVYWCVVRAAVKVEPNYSPAGVTAEEMLKAWTPRPVP